MADLTPQTRQRVIDMYKEGRKTREITAETGVGRSTLYFLLSEEGITPQRRDSGATKRVGGADKQKASSVRSATPSSRLQAQAVPETGSPLLDWALAKVLEQEQEIGRLQGQLEAIRALLYGP